jgi:hypothetical protein
VSILATRELINKQVLINYLQVLVGSIVSVVLIPGHKTQFGSYVILECKLINDSAVKVIIVQPVVFRF